MASADDQSQAGRAALAALCQTYWYPLYAFARRRGHSPPDAQDLTQGFFLHVLEHQTLSQVDRLKEISIVPTGLLSELHFGRGTASHRLKRGGNCRFVSLDLETAEDRYRLEPTDYLTAETIFEARWALTLLTHAMTLLRLEYLAKGREAVFDILKAFVGIGETDLKLRTKRPRRRWTSASAQ